VVAAFAPAGHASELVVAEAVAAVEVADAVRAVVGGRQPDRLALPSPGRPVMGADRQRPELVESEAAVEEFGGDFLDPVQLRLPVGVGDSFQVRVRWNDTLCSRSRCRSRSRPMFTIRTGLAAR
jgi:hypothetical protein